MAKASHIEQLLTQLHSLRGRTDAPETREELRRALAHKANLVVAKAARIVEEAKIAELGDNLVAAFGRFMADPAAPAGGREKAGAADRGCEAKTAIVAALYEIEHPAEAVFLRGVRYVQREPAYGGSVDTAAELRGVCCLGLVQVGYRQVMNVLVERLVDGEAQTRLLAARAVGGTGSPEGVNLLKLRLLCGESEPDVVAEIFAALLSLSGSTLEFVARFLGEADEAVSQAAALAIGGSRRPGALETLLRHWQDHIEATTRRMLLLPIVMTRAPEALGFVLDVVASAPAALAEAAIEALAIHRNDAAVRDRIQKLLKDRGEDKAKSQGDATLGAAFARYFG